MTQELTKELMCIALRNGVELWLEKERLDNLIPVLESKKFIEIDGRIINSADVVGIFNASDMEEVNRRKNGQWKGKDGKWYNRGDRVCRCKNIIPYGKTCGNCA